MQGWGEASVHPFLVHNYHRPQGGKFSALTFEGNSSFSDKPWTRSKPATFATFPGGSQQVLRSVLSPGLRFGVRTGTHVAEGGL